MVRLPIGVRLSWRGGENRPRARAGLRWLACFTALEDKYQWNSELRTDLAPRPLRKRTAAWAVTRAAALLGTLIEADPNCISAMISVLKRDRACLESRRAALFTSSATMSTTGQDS